MQYIDKNTHRVDGNRITLDYLDTCCRDASGHYSGIVYKSKNCSDVTFRTGGTPQYSQRMAQVLLENQNYRCCYCMRKLEPNPPVIGDAMVTIEHVVPRSFTGSANGADFARYKSFVPGMNYVELNDVFEAQAGAQTVPPFPHAVAYDNMVVSCNGTFPSVREIEGRDIPVCCNRKRGDASIMPVYFLPDIEGYIDYQKNGGMQAKPTSPHYADVDEVIRVAELYCDSLREVRRLWFELRNCTMEEIQSCATEMDREAVLNKALNVSLAMREPLKVADMISKYKKKDYWDTLMLYDVFYAIMSRAI